MSSRFVSGGTIASSGEVSKEPAAASSDAATTTTTIQDPPVRNKEWEAVQKELEAERKQREEARAKAAAGQEQSLYDVLQANKAAKQAAFEEQNKIRNQFRALDDDEIGFLDEVRDKKRKEEEQARREVEEGLKAFREQQKTDGKVGPAGDDEVDDDIVIGESWGVGRKRKRVKDRERDLKGVRRRVSSSENPETENSGGNGKSKGEEVKVSPEPENQKVENSAKGESEKKVEEEKKKTMGGRLGLVAYDSDDDSD